MSRNEALDELAEIRAAILRLKAREDRILARIDMMEDPAPRPGWPIQRGYPGKGARISTSSPSRIAV